jgi:hypothetical protein
MVEQKIENLYAVVQFYPGAWIAGYGVKASIFVLGAEGVRSSRTIPNKKLSYIV